MPMGHWSNAKCHMEAARLRAVFTEAEMIFESSVFSARRETIKVAETKEVLERMRSQMPVSLSSFSTIRSL